MESEEYHIIQFESYLRQRTQYVKIEDIRSNTETLVYGIPQGSTLGPLLFLLYVNDLPNSSSRFFFRIFGDDTNMFFSSSCLNELMGICCQQRTSTSDEALRI